MTSNHLSAELDRRLGVQVETWRRDLLTIDRRQKLVYFAHTRTASLEVVSPGPTALFPALSSPMLVASEEDGPARAMLVSGKTPGELASSCRRLDLTSQQVYADRGFWTLYVGLGMLRWIDPSPTRADKAVVHAPLVLVPVELRRSGSQSPYFVVRNDEDDVVVNPALRLHLEKTFDLTLPDLDIDDPDVPSLLAEVGSKVQHRAGWGVEERSVLTTFSFHKEAIYRDLEDHESVVRAHPLVRLIALGADAPGAAEFGFERPGTSRPIDDEQPPEELVSILDADSSQRACILAARAGHSFVMDGPPGTGKSQTIANIIAELIAAGRRVLFVSEKAAALDVVRDRLSDKHLGDFLLELHSHAATRKEVVKQLNDALTQRMSGRGAMSDYERKALVQVRTELTEWADAVNTPLPLLGRTLHSIFGRLSVLDRLAHTPVSDPTSWRDLTASRFEELLDLGGRLGNAWRPVLEGPDFLWRDLASSPHSRAQIDRAYQVTSVAGRAAEALSDRCRTVDQDLGLSWPSDFGAAARRLRLLQLLESRPPVPVEWLCADPLDTLTARVVVLRRAVDRHEEATAALGALIGPEHVDALDPDRCVALERSQEPTSLVWLPASESTSTQVDGAVAALTHAPLPLAEVLEDARQLGGMLGVPTERISLRRAIELGELAALGGAPARPERTWLNPSIQTAIEESMRVLGPVVDLVRQRRDAMESVFRPEALEQDLGGLEVRFRETHTGMRRWSSAARADRRLLKTLTVNGKADKQVRSHLEEAVAWQKAEAALDAAEGQHAALLGSYYQEVTTDFGRLSQALDNARRAVELAGNDLNSGPMGDQLGVDGAPDARLTVVAQHLLTTAERWMTEAAGTLGAGTVDTLASVPLDVAADQCATAAQALAPLRDALLYAASAAGRDLGLGDARAARDAAIAGSQALVTVYDDYDGDAELLGELYSGLTTEWGALDKALDWLRDVREILGDVPLSFQAIRMFSPVVLSEDLKASIDAWTRSRDELVSLFVDSRTAVLQSDLDGDLPEAAEILDEMHAACVTDIGEWDAFVATAAELRARGLSATLAHLEERRAPAEDVRPSIEWAALQAVAEATIAADPRLGRNRSQDRRAQVRKFRDLDTAQVRQANAAVAAACSARRPSSMTGASAQVIRREAQKKTRHLPIRELLHRTHEIVQELKPCFMMSPLSVSQFLPSDMAFDVVIFDEASQVLPSDAVNCIYRGRQLIVAGDEKQLPPTSFFAQASSDEDVDEEIDVFESVLKSCKSALPSLPLTWHYRSQHESLITFSNYRFYAPDGDPLQSFPSATFTSPDLGVEAVFVHGVYQRGGARDNPIEAQKVVDRILWHREQHPELSLGVVTFSSAQEAAVSSALEARAATEPALAGLLDDHDRLNGFFVKNLENVQGDERDIIIFSLGYGPDETGRFTMNFGPVGRAGGWRRLNVAITRARRRVEVVSSFRAGDLKETANENLAHLRAYLAYAERGRSTLEGPLEVAESEISTDLENEVAAALEQHGYLTERRVGSAGYKIDVAVRHPQRDGEFVLAVECDGPSYHSAASARDRDRLRASVLRGLGWSIYRVWGVAWYRDREDEIRRLVQSVERAVAGVPDSSSLHVEPEARALEVEQVDLDAPPGWTALYRTTDHQSARSRYAISEVEARPVLQDFVAHVLAAEAPVHRDVLYRRVREAFGVGRVGSQIKANIDFVAARTSVNGQRVELDALGFYRTGPADQVRVPADAADARTVAQTPPDEIDLAVVGVVRDAVTAERDAVVTAVSRLFGWRRAGSDIQAALTTSVERCLARGDLERTAGGGLRVVSR